MRYQGGKRRQSSQITPWVVGSRADRTTYIEPFLGAGSVAARLNRVHGGGGFEVKVGNDKNQDLVLLWDAVRRGWQPPVGLTREQYQGLRDAEPSALRAFAGYACSFGAKWFGGYARDNTGTDYVGQGSRSVIKRSKELEGLVLLNQDYRDLVHLMDRSVVVYADPPYRGVTPYSSSRGFDSDLFWRTMRRWVGRGALVFVTEFTGDEGWECVQEFKVPSTTAHGRHRETSEGLFVHRSQLGLVWK